MKVSFVLSSGCPLFELQVLPNTSVQELKPVVVQALNTQLDSYPLFPSTDTPPCPALSFQASPEEDIECTKSFLRTYSPRLFIYQGEELLNNVHIKAIHSLVCVLRPTDLEVRYINLREMLSRGIINTEARVVWKAPTDAEAIDTLIATPSCYVVCCALPSDTVFRFKRRFSWMFSCPFAAIEVTHKGQLLEENSTLDSYQIRDWSFLSANSPSEEALPEPNSSNFPNYTHILHKIHNMWRPFISFPKEIHCMNRLKYSETTHAVSFQLNATSTIAVKLPIGCDVLTAKRCISEQHGFPAEMVGIGVTIRLNLDKNADDYGLKSGDVLVMYRKEVHFERIKLYFSGKNNKKIAKSFNLCEQISTIKKKIKHLFRYLRPPLTLMSELEVLEDSHTLADYGLDDEDLITVTSTDNSSGKTPQIAENQGKTCIEIERNLYPPLDYLYFLRVKCPGETVYVRLHEERKAADVKEELKAWLHLENCVLRQGERELAEEMTLIEQKVGYTDTLQLMTPSSIAISVVTPTGRMYPAVLEPDKPLITLNTALGRLAGVQKKSMAYIYAKRLVNGGDKLPVEGLQVWVQLGAGTEVQLAVGRGREVRVEASAAHTIARIREELRLD